MMLYRLSFYLRSPRDLGECLDYARLVETVAPAFAAACPLFAMEYDSPDHFIACWCPPTTASNPTNPREPLAAAAWWLEVADAMRKWRS